MAAFVAMAALCSPAHAAPIDVAKRVADKVYGPDPCGSALHIEWMQPPPFMVNWDGDSYSERNLWAWTDYPTRMTGKPQGCWIRFNVRYKEEVTPHMLCVLWLHERGHRLGLRHNRKRRSIMRLSLVDTSYWVSKKRRVFDPRCPGQW